MALPPTIPTSFVPHAASAVQRRFRTDLTGAFGFFAYAVLAITVALALGVFLYGRILASSLSAKEVALKEAQQKIELATVENFVRLRNRLSSSETMLEKHIAFSGFFAALEKALPTTVRFVTLTLTVNDTGAAKIEGTGVAKSFNALAAASNAFANGGYLKDAIFSDISVNKNSSVSFALSATLDPKLIVFTPDTTASAAVPASSEQEALLQADTSQPDSPPASTP